MGNRMRFYFLAAIFLLYLLNSTAYAANPAAQTMAAVVEASKAQAATYQASVNSVGTLVAEQGITVKSEVAGRVTKILFQSGQYVKQGAPLVQIYPDILQAELAANQAAAELSKVNYQRNEMLYKKGAISISTLDQAAAQLKSDDANVEKTQAQLSQTLVTAPFNGFLGIRQISLGDYLNAGSAIVNLEDVDPIFVDFSVPEKYLMKIRTGDNVTITSNTYGSQTFIGKVIAKDSLINANTRTLSIRAVAPNPKNELAPGSFVEVSMQLGQPENLVLIPQTALSYSKEGAYVFRIVDGKAVKTVVELGERENKDIYITKGLAPGDAVVSAGSLKLHDGSIVKIRTD